MVSRNLPLTVPFWPRLLQILTITQQATGIVEAFPYIPEQPRLVEALAALHSEPPIASLTQAVGIENVQLHTNWRKILEYLSSVTSENVHLYVPILLD